MLKIKVFGDPISEEEALNAFIGSVDLLEGGLKVTQAGTIILLYKDRDTEEQKKKAQEEARAEKMRSPAVDPDYTKTTLLDMLGKAIHDLAENSLKFHVFDRIARKKRGSTQAQNQTAINAQQAERAVEQSQAEVDAIRATLADIESGALSL